ncbi:MAG: hypothetical protein PHN53_08165 [Eubacteriales bacterium]|nr:hypothetical protein [Eubacteriales bacterium]
MQAGRGFAKRKIPLAILIGLLAAAVLFAALSFWQRWFWFAEKVPALSVAMPGALDEGCADCSDGSENPDKLEGRMRRLLEKDGQLLAWYRLAGKTGQPPDDISDAALGLDQILYGQILLEQNRRKDFAAWWTSFSAGWITPDGFCKVSRGDFEPAVAQDDLRTQLALARLLAQSISVWPDPARYRQLADLSDALLSRFSGQAPTDSLAVVPTPEPILDPGATPTPKPTVSPEPKQDARRELPVLRLASIDLFALQALGQVDSAWLAVYETYLARVEGGLLGDSLPLYAWAWQPESGGYLPFGGSVAAIDTAETLRVVLHLCEVGHTPQRSLAWIRAQLFNQSALYASYHPGQGTPVDQQECLEAYAMTARIARITGDGLLYRTAVDRLLWHQATSQTSPALSAIFRQAEDGAYYVWARDNLWALLALR